MTTRFYLRNTTNATSGLPTTKQTTQTIQGGASQSANKDMVITIGTSQTSISFTASGSGIQYFSRWVSDTIGQSSIAANTWTWTFAYSDSAIADSQPNAALYLWRPGTGKVATIFDGLTSTISSNNSERGHLVTFSGAAIASGIQSGDVLCFEGMVTAVAPISKNFYYDGTTVITSNNSAASSAASYIETPETIALGFVPGVDATVTGKTNTNKFINKV